MLLIMGLLLGCRGSRNVATRDSLDVGGVTPKDSADSVLLTPRVVTGPTVLVFWLPAADTLSAPDQASALDDLTYYTDRIAPLLLRHAVLLVPTNADTVYVALPNRQRQAILLSGLDYPFGYVLIAPGEAERILAGVYAEDELFDEVQAYFGLPPDTLPTRARITT
jgi:hypothetical protein